MPPPCVISTVRSRSRTARCVLVAVRRTTRGGGGRGERGRGGRIFEAAWGLFDTETLAEGDRWRSSLSYRAQPPNTATIQPWFELLSLRVRRTSERRVGESAASLAGEAGGFGVHFEVLRRLLRRQVALATVLTLLTPRACDQSSMVLVALGACAQDEWEARGSVASIALAKQADLTCFRRCAAGSTRELVAGLRGHDCLSSTVVWWC